MWRLAFYPAMFLIGCLAIGAMIFNAKMGWEIGQQTEWVTGWHNGYLYATLFVVMDAIKMMLPAIAVVIAIGALAWYWRLLGTTIAAGTFAIMTAISLSGIYGSLAIDRDTMTAGRSKSGDEYRDKTAKADALRAKIDAASSDNPDRLRSQIAAYKVQPDSRWGPTNGCTPEDVTIPKSQMWCKEYHRLEAQLAEAREIKADEARLRDLEAELAGMAGAVEGDPQARRIGDATGLEPDKFITSLIAAITLVIEFAPPLLPVVLLLWMRTREADQASIVTDAAETVTDARSAEEEQSEAYRIILNAWERQKALKAPECPVELALYEHRREHPDEADEISYPNLSNRVSRICRQRGETPWGHRKIGMRMVQLGCGKSLSDENGGSVTYYDLSGLGGAQTELAHAA